MKTRVTGVLAAAALAVAALGGPVAADAEPNDHNCGGAYLSLAAPGEVFTVGELVQIKFALDGPGSFEYQAAGRDCEDEE